MSADITGLAYKLIQIVEVIVISAQACTAHSKDLGTDGKIILKWILGNGVEMCGLDASASGQKPVAGSCEHGNEPCGSI
jgi:hypothetical protein